MCTRIMVSSSVRQLVHPELVLPVWQSLQHNMYTYCFTSMLPHHSCKVEHLEAISHDVLSPGLYLAILGGTQLNGVG